MRSSKETPYIRKRILTTDTTLALGEKKALRRGALYWVSDDMSLLAHKTSMDMPEWSPIMCKPAASGVIVLAEPLPSTNPRVEPELIITWVTNIDASMTVRVYSNFTGAYVLTSRIDIPADVTLPIETTPTQGSTLLAQLANSFGEHHPSYAPNHAVLQVLGAAWILMQQDTIAKPRQERIFPSSRGGQGKSRKPDLVQVISLRRVLQPPTRDDDPAGGGNREYHVRWLVKGHWRQQRVGPGRKYRRPTYIAPHIKGPVGAPMKTDKVHVWRR